MVNRTGFLPMLTLAAFLAVPMAGAQGTQAIPKVAYIDSRIIVEQTPGRAQLAAQFQKEILVPLQARLKAMADSDAAIIKRYSEDEPTLSVEARASRQKEINDKRNRWRVEADSLNQDAGRREEELQKPMTDLLKKILGDIRAEEGLWYIFDVAAEAGMSIVAIDKNMDITQRVIDRYKTAAAALGKPGAVGGPPTGGPVSGGAGVGRIIPPHEQ
jgi:Skp family chaperone for outer membrane proteins